MRTIKFRGKSIRTIRFRGKSIKSCEWVYGYYAIHHISRTGRHDEYLGVEEHHCIFNDIPGERSKGGFWCEVYPQTVGQFTGTTDDAGNEIYEGDIVSYLWRDEDIRPTTAEVKFNSKNAQFHMDSGGEINITFEFHDNMSISLEGNVYDNPELLNK